MAGRSGSTHLKEGLLHRGGSRSVIGKNGIPEPPVFYASMCDPRELLAFGAVAFALFIAMCHNTWVSPLPARTMHRLYVLTLAVEFLIWSTEFCGHVAWLSASKFTKRRGLGKWASPLYGFVPMPALSAGWFAVVQCTLIATLVAAAWFPDITPLAYCLACLVMSHLFWDRQNIGGHGGLPVIHTLFCLSMQVEENQIVVLGCIQVLLGASYFASALCKLVTSLFIQRPWKWWGTGDGMKFYLLDSVSVRPMCGIRYAVREWVLTGGPGVKNLFGAAMNGALIFELAVPVLACFHARGATLALFVFHYSVWFLFDIDFLSFWGPSLLALAVVDWTVFFPTWPAMLGHVESALTEVPVRTTVLLLYTGVQIIVSLMVYDLNPRNKELLPFSAYPMFEEATRMFEEDQAMALVLRVPTKVPMPEPYYLRMSALSTSDSGEFLSGPAVLEDIGQRVLVVGIPKQAKPRGKVDEAYVGGVWRPQPAQATNGNSGLDNCAWGITTVMSFCGAQKGCSCDAGEFNLNHERECAAESEENVILAGNVDWTNAKLPVQNLIHQLIRMTPKDAWSPEKMRALLAAYHKAELSLARCPRSAAFREEMSVRTCTTPVLKASAPPALLMDYPQIYSY